MNQAQIENLSTEEYSYFLAYGSSQESQDPLNMVHVNTFCFYETSDNPDERELPQGLEDVCSNERHDGIGCVLQDVACTYTQRSTYE